jgi:hypothetical protein
MTIALTVFVVMLLTVAGGVFWIAKAKGML